MRLRLYHHRDGARVAYREIGAGPALCLLHSALLSHLEFEPAARELASRYRVVLPDLPLHGDSEDRPRHPYTLDWYAEVMSAFANEVLGPRPLIGGHDAGAEIVLHATLTGRLTPRRMVIMSSRLHGEDGAQRARRLWRATTMAGAVPGVDRLLSYAAPLLFSPSRGRALSARGNPAAADLMRHAFADVPGNSSLARSWAKVAAAWPRGAQSSLRSEYGRLQMPVLLLWADRDPLHPLAVAEEALELLPAGQLRVVGGTGFLMAYDDPVSLAREIAAFCG
ncbi:MAG TPA: alpha/beta hydrolase [Solirubrobacteraceae bacterium]|nr:alpha/beta hydrolase [Solirubrobacteraceae bacterium]